jgi:hypothetical protein
MAMAAPGGTVPGVTAPGGVLAVLSGLWWVTGHAILAASGPPAVVVAVLAGTVLAAVLGALAARRARLARMAAAAPLTSRAAALREKSWRAAYARQRDPGAAGRPRPRAPSAAPAAAGFRVAEYPGPPMSRAGAEYPGPPMGRAHPAGMFPG